MYNNEEFEPPKLKRQAAFTYEFDDFYVKSKQCHVTKMELQKLLEDESENKDSTKCNTESKKKKSKIN